MKLNYRLMLPAVAALAIFASCDDNAWNDKLDGFTEPGAFTKIESVSYTLTAADYKAISTNSDNVALAEAAGQEDVLSAIATNCAFASEADARKYIPAFLASDANSFYALNNDSSVDIRFNLTSGYPAVSTYAVTEQDYQTAWDSTDDYIAAFAPMTPAASNLPGILLDAFPDADEDDLVVVSYAQTDTNPIFGSVSGGDTPAWEPTSVLTGIALKDKLKISGYITAITTRGFVVADNAGAILCYQNSGFNTADYNIGDMVNVSGVVSSYGTAFQISLTDATTTVEVVGQGEYTYPTPVNYTGAEMDTAVARTADELAQYCTFVGKATFSGNYINIYVDDAEKAIGSGYYVPSEIKDQIVDGQYYRFYGYFVATSGKGTYFQIAITGMASPDTKARVIRYAPVGTVASYTAYATYKYDGSAWKVPSNTYTLQPADYTAMGQTYPNLSGTTPYTYLPIFLKTKYPYAAAGDVKTIVYAHYNSGSTKYRATEFSFDGTEWIQNTGTAINKFSKVDGTWMYNPSIVITLPYERNTNPSYTWYMDCVDWVFNNISKPEYGATDTSSAAFIDYRGNAEFYSGASAYYGNVDTRVATAKNGAPDGYTGYDGLTDEEITLLVKKRFCTQTLLYAVSQQFPNAAPDPDMEVTVTVNFTEYSGAATVQSVVYTVIGKGQFKYKKSSWVEAGQDADW